MSYLDKKYQELLLNLNHYSLTITLNRPQASNAFSVEMIEDLISVLEQADMDNNVRCIVITGSGKHFCAGGDVKDMQNKQGMFAGGPNELRERYKRGIQKIPLTFEKLSTPVVAKINGAAIGAGLDLACMCDIRVSSDKAKFGETFVKLGLIPGDGGTYFLQRVIGYSKAMELTLTGEVIDADNALKIGLVSKVVDVDSLTDVVEKLTEKIVSNAPIAVQMGKRAVKHSYRNDLDSVLDLLAAYQGITQRTSDHFLGLDGLINKKEVDFKHQ